jgi:DNA-directed RNA polymerase subunit RPC12/RpoP
MSYKVKIEVDGYKCLRCGHKWVPRVILDREPTICPNCKSPYWNKPRRDQKIAKPAIKKQKLRGSNDSE